MNMKNKSIRRSVRAAVRAVYALGLDLGMVLVGTRPSGKTVVLNVDPEPKLNSRLGKLYAGAINQFSREFENEDQRTKPVILGMDPEFVLRGPGGNLVSASKFLTKQGKVGCDAIWLDRNRTIFPLVELRPEPSTEPRQLISNLYKTMLLAARKINRKSLDWLAGAAPLRNLPLGGHIHMSQIWLNSRLLRVLDNYLALPLVLLEDRDSGKRRPKYGFLGDFREQFHGGFEYRTPPSWIISPKITKGVVALAKLISENYNRLPQRPLMDIELQRAYYEGNKTVILPHVGRLWSDLEGLSDYRKYAQYLDPFKELLARMEQWKENQDIRKAWKIPPFHRTGTVQLANF